MAPAVPFALLGVVQLVAVAGWVGLAGAAAFPRLRRPVTPVFAAGALVLAAADALTAVQFSGSGSDVIAWLRVAGLLLLATGAVSGVGQSPALALPAGALGGVVVPLGSAPSPAWLGGVAGLGAALGALARGRRNGADRWLATWLAAAFALTGVAAVLAQPAHTSSDAALAVLAVRAAATVAIVAALAQLARANLVGKLTGAIVAGVVAMAAGAVGVVGTGVAADVQSQQSQRLLQVAESQQQSLRALTSRAALFAQVVAQCPTRPKQCAAGLTLFSDQPDYFAAVVYPNAGAVVEAPNKSALSHAALIQLAGSSVVRAALQPGATAQSAATDALLLPGATPTLAEVAAVPGRSNGSTDARIKPDFAAVYGVGIVDPFLSSIQRQTGYDVSVIAGGRVIASSLGVRGRAQILSEAQTAGIDSADALVSKVVPAEGDVPTAAFVSVSGTGNDDVRIATLAISQPANEALRAQRSVLQRTFLTALVALLAVALLALALAQRIADPVRRLTAAAGRVRRGDLEARTSVAGRDEVGSLARAFDAMTASLRTLTGDLRATAAAEAATRARLQTVVESMSDGLVVTDAAGIVTDVNPTAARLLRVDAADVVGRQVAELLDVVDDEERSLLASVVDGGEDRWTMEARLRPVGGGPAVPVRLGAAPLADGHGRVVVLADRSREDEVERMKTEFLANVSHELRTPLTPIRGYAEMLVRRPDLSRDQAGRFLEEILTSTTRMSRVVELLVDVAALEGGRIATRREMVPVRGLVDDRLEAWKERYPERAADFKRRVGARLPSVDIDLRWVNRALDEFADNAVKYTPAGAAIWLVAELADEGRRVRVGVKDAGPGFDPNRAAELVGDFSQGDASDTRRVGGLGLGLGFVTRVAERLDLPFVVDTAPGRGAEFALLVPVGDDGPPAPRRRATRAKPARKIPAASSDG